MSNIKYFAADKIGNEYIVQSKLAEFDPNQPNLILMEKVEGVIQFTNSSPILISSDKAIYNKLIEGFHNQSSLSQLESSLDLMIVVAEAPKYHSYIALRQGPIDAILLQPKKLSGVFLKF